jgi:FkbM family methyltransferase
MRLEISQKEYISLINDRFNPNNIKNIMEIGSLDGKDSLFYKSEYPNANVYTIEGLYDNYEKYLKDNKDIIAINVVITDHDGTIDYHKKNVNGIHGIFNRGDEYGTEIIKSVECKTFKTLCDEYNIDNIDFIKIDVEGASYEVIKGMGDRIKGIKMMHIETESYPFFKNQKLHDDVCKLLEENNYQMIDITSVNISQGKQHDSVWLNKKFL